MPRHYLTVDGFRYSTGIRDQFSGEYLELETLNLSPAFRHHFSSWLNRYQQAQGRYDETHLEPYFQALDEEGLHLAKELKTMLGGEFKISYYSDAFSKRFLV